MIKEFFKVPVYDVNLNCDILKMQEYCFDMKKNNKGTKKSNNGGWQSENLQGVHLPLNEMFEDIEHHFIKYAEVVGVKKEIVLDNVWININGYKDYNVPHSHPNTPISGVFYVKCPENCGSIVFKHPAYMTMQYDWYNNAGNEYSWAIRKGENIENKLYLFPSWLEHSVEPNLNKNEERISISFNSRYKK